MSARDDRPEAPTKEAELEDIELDLLLEGLWRRFGADFRNYARASLRRRVRSMVETEGLPSTTALLDKVFRDDAVRERLLFHFSIHVTTMFRDPPFFVAFREQVLPVLRTHPFIRIWHAGCATGEEVYSMAILLTEAGLYDRSRIYATDMNAVVVEKAKAGIFPADRLAEYEENYKKAGGRAKFSSWYTSRYDHAIFKASLKKNIVFSPHNLAVDRSFNAFNAILCRNVMIYFNPTLQASVHALFYESLERFGFLLLGKGESLPLGEMSERYEAIDDVRGIFRRRS